MANQTDGVTTTCPNCGEIDLADDCVVEWESYEKVTKCSACGAGVTVHQD